MTAFSVRRAGSWFATDWKNSADLGDGPFLGGAPPTYPSKGWAWSSHNDPNDPRRRHPTLDFSQGCDSPGALMFYLDPFEGQGGQGTWSTNFSTDDTIFVGPTGERTGARQEYYMQARVLWDATMATFDFQQINGNPQDGIKFFDASGLLPRGTPFDASGAVFTGTSSCNKTVLESLAMPRRYPKGYGFGRVPTTGASRNGWGWNDGFNPQNLRPAPYCAYPDYANCKGMTTLQWATLTFREKILGRSALSSYFCDFEFDMWFQPDGQSRIKLHAWDPSYSGYVPKWFGDPTNQAVIGVGNLFPYMSSLSPTQDFPRAYVWYDQLIIGPNDPGEADAAGNTSPGVSPTISRPRVRIG